MAWGDGRYKETFDVTGDETPIEKFKELVHPHDAERFWADYAKMLDLTGPQRCTYEYRVQRTDGEVRWVRVSWLTHREGAGRERRVANVVGTVRDITERKHHEELLRRQADLLDQSHDAIFTWKIGGGITYWNRGAEVLYGYSREEAIGRVSHDLLRTRSTISDQERETRVVEAGRWNGELIHLAHDGYEIAVESEHVRVFYDGEIFALETNRDITARKRAEEDLRKSEERFKASVLRSPVPTLLFDNRERILAVSRSWLTAAGFLSADEFQRV